MKFQALFPILGLAAVSTAIPTTTSGYPKISGCNSNLCLRDLLRERDNSKDCLSYATVARASTPTFTFSRTIHRTVFVTSPSSVTTVTKTRTEDVTEVSVHTVTATATTTSTSYIITTRPSSSAVAEKLVANKKNAKRDASLTIPRYASIHCDDYPGEYLSACSCLLKTLGSTLPPVTPVTTATTITSTIYSTQTSGVSTNIVDVIVQATKRAASTTTVTDYVTATTTALALQPTSFKIKFKNGEHAGRKLFQGPIFAEQNGIFYSMFTPIDSDSLDFVINNDTGLVTSLPIYKQTATGPVLVTPALNLTWTPGWDDPDPSFVLLMTAEAQANPDYEASPIKCSIEANGNLPCVCGVKDERNVEGWYAFGIDEENYIPTAGLARVGHAWASFPGARVFLAVEWNYVPI